MNYKQMLIDIVNKSKTSILEQGDYVKCKTFLQKLDDIEKDFNKINLLTDLELSLLSNDKLRRVVDGIKAYVQHSVYDEEEIKKWLFILKQDINHNAFKKYNVQIKKLDEIYNIVSSDNYSENYELLLSFIKEGYENGLINSTDAIYLNFYLVSECSKQKTVNTLVLEEVIDEKEVVIETVELDSNEENIENKLREIFSLHGYDYDCLGRMKDKFNKYVKTEYLDYVLYKFNYYGITSKEIAGYAKTLFRILIDNDRESFDAICKFVDDNGCSLRYLLAMPSVFSRNKRKYIPRGIKLNDDKTKSKEKEDKDFEINGSFDSFFKNVEMYKRLNKKEFISDEDLMKSAKFLSTPSSLVEKNLKLLLKYKVVAPDNFPSSSVSLCGIHTEYLIDRFIEAGLYESYLSLASTSSGTKARGSSYLSGTDREFKFYKIKRANDLGESIMASNGGIRTIFNDDNVSYSGINLRVGGNGEHIVQEPLSIAALDSINPSIRKKLSDNFYDKEYTEEKRVLLEFDNLYKYRTYSPLDIFPKDDLRGEIVNKIFAEDFKTVSMNEGSLHDEFIDLLDRSFYTDSDGAMHPIKTSEFKYEFADTSFPNLKVIVSRQKVIRLLELLKQRNFRIDSNLSMRTKIDVLLSVALKDTIISEQEKMMVRFVIKLILENKLVLADKVERGARKC